MTACKDDHCAEVGCRDEEARVAADIAEALETLERWHNETHTGLLRFCREQPCAGVTNTLG